MIISFNIENPEDLELLLSITKRLGIERVEKAKIKNRINSDTTNNLSQEIKGFNEINDEIDSIFGINNSNISF
jgi:hypothetical protein